MTDNGRSGTVMVLGTAACLCLYCLILAIISGNIGFEGDDWWVLSWPYWHRFPSSVWRFACDCLRPIEGVYWICLFEIFGFNRPVFHVFSLLLAAGGCVFMGLSLAKAFPGRVPFVATATMFAFFLPSVSPLTYVLATDNSRLSLLLFWACVLAYQRWAGGRASWLGLLWPWSLYALAFCTYEAPGFLLFAVPWFVWPVWQRAPHAVPTRVLILRVSTGIVGSFISVILIRFLLLQGGAVTQRNLFPPLELLWAYPALLPFYLVAPFTDASAQWTELVGGVLVALAAGSILVMGFRLDGNMAFGKAWSGEATGGTEMFAPAHPCSNGCLHAESRWSRGYRYLSRSWGMIASHWAVAVAKSTDRIGRAMRGWRSPQPKGEDADNTFGNMNGREATTTNDERRCPSWTSGFPATSRSRILSKFWWKGVWGRRPFFKRGLPPTLHGHGHQYDAVQSHFVASGWYVAALGLSVLVLGFLPYQLAGYGAAIPRISETAMIKWGVIPEGFPHWFNFNWSSRVYSAGSYGVAILLAAALTAWSRPAIKTAAALVAIIWIGFMASFHIGLSRDWREAAQVRTHLVSSLVTQVPDVPSHTNFLFIDLDSAHGRAPVFRGWNGLRELVRMLYSRHDLGAWYVYPYRWKPPNSLFHQAVVSPEGFVSRAMDPKRPAAHDSLIILRRSGTRLIVESGVNEGDCLVPTGIHWQGSHALRSNMTRIRGWYEETDPAQRPTRNAWDRGLFNTLELSPIRLSTVPSRFWGTQDCSGRPATFAVIDDPDNPDDPSGHNKQ